MSRLTVERLSAGYAGNDVIRELTFSLEPGRLLGLLGANGSGKTTLLKSICGILPHRGSCRMDSTPLERLSARELARICSYIPQRSGLSIDIPALDVVMMGFNPQLGLLERPGKAMREAAEQALVQVGLCGYGQVNYLHLSEGQKQLCILARTLVADARLLLLDEPESALDFRFRYRMLEIIRRWVHTQDRCAVVALHDPSLALNYCDELLLLADGGCAGRLCPAADSEAHMEKLLSAVYGPVTVTGCRDRTGRRHIVMLKEQEVMP